ncbi:MAG TPA: DUF2273 domain-containing protein [Bacillota bacterium]|nr:DUF2273 domain-containing protein [Bacillota bacterium]
MFWQLITENPGKTIGVFAGLVLGLLYIFFGFFNTLVIVVFVTVGFYMGSKFDNRENLLDFLDRILPGKYTKR